jgi:hypothetical protein
MKKVNAMNIFRKHNLEWISKPELLAGKVKHEPETDPDRASGKVLQMKTSPLPSATPWRMESIPFIPSETEIDQLIAVTSSRVAAFLRVIKEACHGADQREGGQKRQQQVVFDDLLTNVSWARIESMQEPKRSCRQD